MAGRSGATDGSCRRGGPSGRLVALVGHALVGLAAVVGLPRGAAAEDATPTIGILGLGGALDEEATAARLDAAVRRAIASAGAVAADLEGLRGLRDLALPAAGRERIASLREEARGHFLDFRFPEAAADLELALEAIVARYGDLLEDPELVAVRLDLARVYLEMGRADAARSTLLELARRRGDISPDPADYPPALIEAWQEARAAVGAEPPAVVAPSPARAASFGQALALSHVVTGLVTRHEGGGLVLRLTVVDCATAEVVPVPDVPLGDQGSWGASLSPVLGPLFAHERTAEPEAPPATELFVLSTPPGAAIVLDGTPRDERTPATIPVAPGIHHLRLSREGHRAVEVSVMAWEHQTRPVEVTLPGPEERSAARSWWLWTLVGVTAAGAVVGLTFWALWAAEDLPDLHVATEPSSPAGLRF